MKMFQATVRPDGGCIIQKIEVMAAKAIEAKNNLEMEFGNGNVVYFPQEIRWVFKLRRSPPKFRFHGGQ